MKRILIAPAVVLLAGCGSIPTGTFANRLSCTLDRSEAYVNSMYGPLGLTSKVYAADAAVACAAAPATNAAASAAK